MNTPKLAQNKKEVLFYSPNVVCPLCLTAVESQPTNDSGELKCGHCERFYSYEILNDGEYQMVGKIGDLDLIAAYADTGIYGTADTAEGAIMDARIQKGYEYGEYETGEMSPYLAVYVELFGGDVGFSDKEGDGILRFIDDEGNLI